MYRTMLTSAGVGCAVAFGYRGEWTSAALAVTGVILAVSFWAYGEMAATRATMMRAAPEPAPRPVTRPVTPPRPVRPCRPPWLTAPMPAVPAEPEPDWVRPVARWQQEARVRFPSGESSMTAPGLKA